MSEIKGTKVVEAHQKQMQVGKLTKLIRETSERMSNANKEDGKYYERVKNMLINFGIDKYGPAFDEAVKD